MDGETSFEDWAGIDVGEGLGLCFVFDKFFEFFEPSSDLFVIVAAVGISCDSAVISWEFGLVVIVVCSKYDNTFCVGEQLCG